MFLQVFYFTLRSISPHPPIYHELPSIQNKTRNSVNIIVCNFISFTWLNRDSLEYMEEKVVSKIWKEKQFLLNVLKNKSRETFCIRYCELNRNYEEILFKKINVIRLSQFLFLVKWGLFKEINVIRLSQFLFQVFPKM